MKKMICLLGAALLCGLFTGCASTSTFDASDPTANTARAIGTVSQAECLMAAQAAAKSAISSPAFSRFVRRYQIGQKDELAVPLMQVGYLRNDTNDPDLQMNLVTDELCTALMNSGKVEVTLATGRDTSQTFAEHRCEKGNAGGPAPESGGFHYRQCRPRRTGYRSGLFV